MNHLKSISELQEYYENNDKLFSSLVVQYQERYNKLSNKALHHLAVIRCLEVTNGIVQWSFRLKKSQALSIEQTRNCMQTSLNCIYTKNVNGVDLDHSLYQIMDEVRELYNKGFKNANEESMMHFYAHSAAQFTTIPYFVMLNAMKMVRNNFTYIFTENYVNAMEKYIMRYYDT